MQYFSLAGEITKYFLFHEGNTMFYLCMRHIFSPPVGETKEKKKLRKRLIFQLGVQRVAPLLGMNANAFCLFVCLQPWEGRLLHIIWWLLLPVCLTPETTTAAAEGRSGGGWEGGWGAGDCFCHSYIHCLLDNEWHLLKCHDMAQTKKKHFWKGKNKILFFVVFLLLFCCCAKHCKQLQRLKAANGTASE